MKDMNKLNILKKIDSLFESSLFKLFVLFNIIFNLILWVYVFLNFSI